MSKAPDRNFGAKEPASVEIAPNIQAICELDGSDAHFDYDSEHLQSRDAHIIAQLAACLRDGPLLANHIELIAHMDAGNESASNHSARAASTLRQALAERRIGLPRISIAGLVEPTTGPRACGPSHRVSITIRD